MPEFVKVAKTGDIAPGEGKSVDVGARRIALFNVGGTFYAIDDECTHRRGPLSEGMLMGEEVTCPMARRHLRRHERNGPRRACTARCRPL